MSLAELRHTCHTAGPAGLDSLPDVLLQRELGILFIS